MPRPFGPNAPTSSRCSAMKIVDVAEFYAEQGGGVKTYIHQKLRAGAEAGHEIVIVAPGPTDGVEEKFGGRIVWTKSPPMPFDPRYYVLYNERAVHEILDREQPDVVEGSSPWSGGWFVNRWRGDAIKSLIFHQDPVAVYAETLLDRRLGRPTINRVFSPFWGYLRKLSGRYDVTVTSGAWLADKLRGFGIANPQPVSFGIDKQRFSPDHFSPERRADLLRRCGVSTDARLLVTVSRMHPEKRLGALFDAFAEARRDTEMGLVVYGDGPMRDFVRRHARRVPNVYLAGYTSEPNELPEVYASADALLHASAAETYGLVVAEALCSGTPVIVPDVGGAADLARPEWSETWPPGDVAAGAAAIRRMLSRDRDALRDACAEAATSHITTMDDHFVALFELYADLVDRA